MDKGDMHGDVSSGPRAEVEASSISPHASLVAIGSKNPAKTTGVRNAFATMGMSRIRFVEVEAGSITREQPFGFAETIQGAKDRAQFAMRHAFASSSTDAASSSSSSSTITSPSIPSLVDLGIGVEAGILLESQEHLNLQIAAIVDRRGVFSIGSSAGFMLPSEVVTRMRTESRELDRYAHELTGAPKIREVDGIVYHLSKERITRVQMTEQCVTMALIPLLNPKLYGRLL